jgi:GT2 family glycosyltransferase
MIRFLKTLVRKIDSYRQRNATRIESLWPNLSMEETFCSFENFEPEMFPGIRGERISIVILDHKRLELTKRFLNSIPVTFQGEILVYSQGNLDTHNSALTEYVEKDKRVKLHLSPENLGVAVGRNKAFQLTAKPWILSLDNDIYFTSDPFSEIEKIVRRTLTKFANVSLSVPGNSYYSIGSSVFTWKDGSYIRAGMGSSLDVKKRYEPGIFFETSALMGGASLINKNEFFRLGGYDSAFFIGFEDLDFSIRILLAGMKVVSSTSVFFCHDHVAPANEIDKSYEVNRFNTDSIKESAAIIEKKYGIKVWGIDVENWLSERRRELKLNN